MFRDSKPLAERIELDYFRRPRWLRPARNRLTLAVFLGCVAWVAFTVSAGRHRSYYAGSVSTSHRFIESDCQQCHTDAWQPFVRLATFNDGWRSTSEGACTKCHDGPTHSDQQPLGATPACAECHREHHGQTRLADVANRFCTGCHAELKRTDGASSKFENVRDFAWHHPEFGKLRRNEMDPAVIRFNHEVHLKPGGIATLAGDRRVPQCTECHKPDAERRYILPINYERHCAECHSNALTMHLVSMLPNEDARKDAEQLRVDPLPHRSPETVRAVAREHLTQFARKWSDFITVGDAEPAANGTTPPRQIAGRPRPPSVSEREWEWINQQLVDAERVLFTAEGGCRYCHTLNESGPSGLPVVAETKIAKRWFNESRFRHDSHRELVCTQCHAAKSSKETSDILMPSIESCRQCHAPGRGAKTDCIECHEYHHHQNENFNGQLRIDLTPASDGGK